MTYGNMTPMDLQDQLVADLKELFENTDYLMTMSGERRAPIVYKQDLPVPQNNDEDTDDDVAPYIIVRIGDGTFDTWGEAVHVSVMIIVCTYDNSEDRQGVRDVMGMLARIYHKFAAWPHVGNFTCELPIEWAVQHEIDTHPYYFGGVSMTWSCPGTLIEDPLT